MSLDHSQSNAASAALEQQAWLWLGRLQGQPTPALRAEFEQWLYAAPAHVDAFAVARDLWQLSRPAAASLATEEAVALQHYMQRMQPSGHRLSRWAGALSMAACLVLAIWAGGWQPANWLQDLRADHVSPSGQTRPLTLADGSTLLLDADSAVTVTYSEGERHVELLRGAGFFQVTPGSVPFVVGAKGGEARVLGTAFEVRVLGDGAQVTVAHGRVGVRGGQGSEQLVLTAGQRTQFAGGQVAALEPVDAQAQLSWREGRLTFYKAPLGEVLATLGRYYPGRILLLNDELANRRISGSFPSHDPAAVLASLQAVVGFEQSEWLGRLIILR